MRLKISLFLISALTLSATLPVGATDIEKLRAQIDRGNALMRTYHFTEAINSYEDALKTDPGNRIAKANIAECHNNWGIWYFRQHKFREAYAEWQKCLELAPGHANAKRNIAILKTTTAQMGIDLEAQQEAPQDPNEIPTEMKAGKGPNPSIKPKPSDPPAGADAGVSVGGKSSSFEPKPGWDEAPSQPLTSGKVEQAHEAPSSDTGVTGSVMIISPELKRTMEQNNPPPPTPTPVVATPATPAEGGFGMGSIPPKLNPDQPLMDRPKPPPRVNPLYPVLPTQFSNDDVSQPVGPSGAQSVTPSANQMPTAPTPPGMVPMMVQPVLTPNTVQQPATAYPPSSPASVPPSNGTVYSSSSIDDQLSAIESKVYGHKQGDMTVLQRLEKMEKDTAGQARGGTIIDRINFLRQNYGI